MLKKPLSSGFFVVGCVWRYPSGEFLLQMDFRSTLSVLWNNSPWRCTPPLWCCDGIAFIGVPRSNASHQLAANAKKMRISFTFSFLPIVETTDARGFCIASIIRENGQHLVRTVYAVSD